MYGICMYGIIGTGKSGLLTLGNTLAELVKVLLGCMVAAALLVPSPFVSTIELLDIPGICGMLEAAGVVAIAGLTVVTGGVTLVAGVGFAGVIAVGVTPDVGGRLTVVTPGVTVDVAVAVGLDTNGMAVGLDPEVVVEAGTRAGG